MVQIARQPRSRSSNGQGHQTVKVTKPSLIWKVLSMCMCIKF